MLVFFRDGHWGEMTFVEVLQHALPTAAPLMQKVKREPQRTAVVTGNGDLAEFSGSSQYQDWRTAMSSRSCDRAHLVVASVSVRGAAECRTREEATITQC